MKPLGRVARVVFGAVMLLGTALSPAIGKDWFDFDREEALRRIRAAVERLEVLAPIPPLTCQPNVQIVRYCESDIADGLQLLVSETAPHNGEGDQGVAAMRAFEAGGPAAVHEIQAALTVPRIPNPAATRMFADLCTAAILALRPSLGPAGARRKLTSALRRAMNKAAAGDGEIVVIGDPETLVVNAWPDGSASCNVTANSEYRERAAEEAAERAATRRRR